MTRVTLFLENAELVTDPMDAYSNPFPHEYMIEEIGDPALWINTKDGRSFQQQIEDCSGEGIAWDHEGHVEGMVYKRPGREAMYPLGMIQRKRDMKKEIVLFYSDGISAVKYDGDVKIARIET